MSAETTWSRLERDVKTLSETVWESRCRQPELNEWLANFQGEAAEQPVERLAALHLLANLQYYGLRELRVLLRALYRDLFRYPIIQELRAGRHNTSDAEVLNADFQLRLKATRFLGMGNPSESGSHLLYYFRQVNGLPKSAFINQHQIFDGPASDVDTKFDDPNLRELVFIDDLLGSGQQAAQYSRTLLRSVQDVAKRTGQKVTTHYFVLFARSTALELARGPASLFDHVEAVHVMEDEYVTFGPESRLFNDPPQGVDKATSLRIAAHYGAKLMPNHPLGYRDSQMLLAFHHNIPDNTLPIIWYDEDGEPWRPIVPRFPKIPF